MSNAVDQRLVELSIIGKHRPLTATEAKEYEESRQYVINREWKVARVMNLMLAARIGKDWSWLSQLQTELKRIQGR